MLLTRLFGALLAGSAVVVLAAAGADCDQGTHGVTKQLQTVPAVTKHAQSHSKSNGLKNWRWRQKHRKHRKHQKTKTRTQTKSFGSTPTARTTKTAVKPVKATSTKPAVGPVNLAVSQKPRATTKPVQSKPPVGNGSSLQTDALTAHNDFRALHGAKPLTWSNDLAAAAQAWADKCVFEHGGGKAIGAGENLAALSQTSASISAGIKMWTDEAKDYKPQNPQYSHFTQVVWKATTHLGCAKAICPTIQSAGFGGVFFVCLYSPPGNVLPYSNFPANVQP